MLVIPHEIFIKQVLPIPANIEISNVKDIDMSKSDYISISLAQNIEGGVTAIYSRGFGGCTGIISLENDQYLQIPNPKIRETHFDPIQLSNEKIYEKQLTCIPPHSHIIIFAPITYIRNNEGKYEKMLHPNLTKLVDRYIKYRTNNYKIIQYPVTENHSFGCIYDNKTKKAEVYTSTLHEPVYSHTFE